MTGFMIESHDPFWTGFGSSFVLGFGRVSGTGTQHAPWKMGYLLERAQGVHHAGTVELLSKKVAGGSSQDIKTKG